MKTHVKFGPTVGDTRRHMEITLNDEAKVTDLMELFQIHYPALAKRLEAAHPVTSGQIVPQDEVLTDGQEIMFISALSL